MVGDRNNQAEQVLRERKANVDAFLEALENRARELELAPPESAVENADGAPEALPAYPILDSPHPPFACTRDLSDAGLPPHSGTRQCTALRWRDGKPCTWKCISRQRFCAIHCVAHPAAVLPIRVQEALLDDDRVKVVQAQDDLALRVKDVKRYISELTNVERLIEEHQQLFLCRGEWSTLRSQLLYS